MKPPKAQAVTLLLSGLLGFGYSVVDCGVFAAVQPSLCSIALGLATASPDTPRPVYYSTFADNGASTTGAPSGDQALEVGVWPESSSWTTTGVTFRLD